MGMKSRSRFILLLIAITLISVSSDISDDEYTPGPVTYNARSLVVGKNPLLIFSGSIHYPRSTPDMWPDILKKAKDGGLNTVETYVHMKKYTEVIVNMMKNERLFAPQGGPIILAQIENEYNHVQESYREKGIQYVKWAADMATELYPEIPWIMCKQKDAPPNVISTCNGRHCADTFSGPNGPDKPALWTENWTAQYRVFGDPPSQRSAEDIAFSVARFFMNNGSMTNYYMYHGGTNFGRTSSSFVTTRYYDEAPLDEFGLIREPKWSHLRDLHTTLRLIKKPFILGNRNVQNIDNYIQIATYEMAGSNVCAAFLSNRHKKIHRTIEFRGKSYFLPRRSIVAQHNSRTFIPSRKANRFKWESYREIVPTSRDLPVHSKSPMELTSMTKDTTDYLWYSTSLHLDNDDLPMRSDILPVIQIQSLGDALLAFVNGEYIGEIRFYIFAVYLRLMTMKSNYAGFGHGSNIEKSFTFSKPANFKTGANQISILAMTVGLPVGTEGEMLQLFTEEGSKKKRENEVIGTSFICNARFSIRYHIPRSFLQPKNNLLVVYEESGGTINGVMIHTVTRDIICSFMYEDYPPSIESWTMDKDVLKAVGEKPKPKARLTCDHEKVIKEIQFASFGNPWGSCGTYMQGTCQAPNVKKIIEKVRLD
ncbi:Galactose-binding domain-like protein [Cynara cardunculus var. scolymus]|uniref:Beta-galactosidase n=1 Tax=Cynara cardunculus var. scolymus TaxID=59895 RepID=A0A103XSF3_CYNCS|nr:Galactose-binding domain-like protein [Cynara cardunculus var. scolymus]